LENQNRFLGKNGIFFEKNGSKFYKKQDEKKEKIKWIDYLKKMDGHIGNLGLIIWIEWIIICIEVDLNL
jgi:hypothetical protein